jgi:hypothetical protein
MTPEYVNTCTLHAKNQEEYIRVSGTQIWCNSRDRSQQPAVGTNLPTARPDPAQLQTLYRLWLPRQRDEIGIVMTGRRTGDSSSSIIIPWWRHHTAVSSIRCSGDRPEELGTTGLPFFYPSLHQYRPAAVCLLEKTKNVQNCRRTGAMNALQSRNAIQSGLLLALSGSKPQTGRPYSYLTGETRGPSVQRCLACCEREPKCRVHKQKLWTNWHPAHTCELEWSTVKMDKNNPTEATTHTRLIMSLASTSNFLATDPLILTCYEINHVSLTNPWWLFSLPSKHARSGPIQFLC